MQGSKIREINLSSSDAKLFINEEHQRRNW